MSVFRMDAPEGGSIDARFIQSCDLTITNVGAEEFDILIHGYHLDGVFFVGLNHVPAGGTVVIPNMMPHNRTFSLLLVTNINYSGTTVVTVHAKNQGQLVALFSDVHFSVIE